MAAVIYDLAIEQGATFYLSFNWYQEDPQNPGKPGDPYDITDCIVRAQIREAQQGTLQFDASTTNGKITLTPLTGGIRMKMSASDTAALTKAAMKYDLELEFTTGANTGDVHRLLKGVVSVDPNITQTAGEIIIE